MSTYKVIQDIEAEDKLIGPLTLRQFIYVIITILILFVAWQLARVQFLLGLPLVIPAAFFGLLSAPIGVHQSSEVWLLAKIRFLIKPRRRIWDQSGLKQLVTITVPKKIEQQLTNNLSQTEVKSRLHALANTIDSRGWAIKNVNVNLSAQSGYGSATSDRLIDISSLPQEVVSYEVTATDDILDEQNNPTAQHLDQMINASSKSRRQEVMANMRAPEAQKDAQAADYWFMNQTPAPQEPGYATFSKSNLVTPGTAPAPSVAAPLADEAAILEKLHNKQQKGSAAYGHMRTVRPLGESNHPAHPSHANGEVQGAAPKAPDPTIMQLANNDDLDVATIARQANKKQDQGPSDEVVISLR